MRRKINQSDKLESVGDQRTLDDQKSTRELSLDPNDMVEVVDISSIRTINLGSASLSHSGKVGATSATVSLYTNAADQPAVPTFSFKYYPASLSYSNTPWVPYTGADNYKWQMSVTIMSNPDGGWPVGTDWTDEFMATVKTATGILVVKLLGSSERYDFLPASIELTKA